MKQVSCIVFALTLAKGAASAPGSEQPETPHLEFVTEYIRELGATERAAAEQDVRQATTTEALLNSIQSSTLIQLELRSQISALKAMHLKHPLSLALLGQPFWAARSNQLSARNR